MPIDVSQLRAHIAAYADGISRDGRQRVSTVADLGRAFQPDFDADALLATCLAATRINGFHWSGALFNCGEAINQHVPFGVEPQRYALIATDGSQILPDRHKPFLFAYLQAGCACVTYGGADQSLASSFQHTKRSRLILESELFDEQSGELKPPSEIANQRDAMEIELLEHTCRIAHDAGFQPVLVADGSLVPFALLNDRALRRDANRARRLLEPVMQALDTMQACGALVCGYIDRPNSNAVTRTCALAGARFDQVDETTLCDADRRVNGLFDRHLLEHVLGPGRRTALFDPRWEVNGPNHLGRHAMRACYVNFGMGAGKQAIIGRIELPHWCADVQRVGTMAAILYRHARIGEGYPLLLKAAHQESVVSQDDQREIEAAIEQALIARGIVGRTSFKQEAKDRD